MFSALVVTGAIMLAIWLIGGAASIPAQLIEVARVLFFVCLIIVIVLVIVGAFGRPHFAGVWW